MCAPRAGGSRRLVGALCMQPGLINTPLQLGLCGGTAGATANTRGAEQAPFFLSRLADATALWVGVVGGALGEPAVAEAAAAAASGADGGLAAVDVQPRAAAVGGVPAVAAQVGIAGRADGTAVGADWTAAGTGIAAPGADWTAAGTGIAAAGADWTAAGTGIAAAGADWTAAGTGIAAAGADWTAAGTGITAAGAGIGAARADWTTTRAGIADAGAGSIGGGTGRCSCVACHWRGRGRVHALEQGARKAWLPAPPDALLRPCLPQPQRCPILKAPLLLGNSAKGALPLGLAKSALAQPGSDFAAIMPCSHRSRRVGGSASRL